MKNRGGVGGHRFTRRDAFSSTRRVISWERFRAPEFFLRGLCLSLLIQRRESDCIHCTVQRKGKGEQVSFLYFSSCKLFTVFVMNLETFARQSEHRKVYRAKIIIAFFSDSIFFPCPTENSANTHTSGHLF